MVREAVEHVVVRHGAQPGHACHENQTPLGKGHRGVSGVILYFLDVVDSNAGPYSSVIYLYIYFFPAGTYYGIFALRLFILTSICALCTFIHSMLGRQRDEKWQQELLMVSSEEKGTGRPWGC